MPRPLRGHQIELEIPADAAMLASEIEKLGFTANAYIDEVAKWALTFAAEEEARLTNILAPKSMPRDPVVCRYYRNVRGDPAWLILRRSEKHWILSAMVSETLSESLVNRVRYSELSSRHSSVPSA
jgi:hypothetical protein